MAHTFLLEAIRSQSANTAKPAAEAEYRGATTAARFTHPQQEFAAMNTGCGIYDLGFRARLSLSGGDRTRWLNGMVSNNIRDLAVNQGVYAFLLNPQGRILGDMYAYNHGDQIVVQTDHSQLEKVIATFDHYIIMDDVEVKDISGEQTALGLSGPKARAILNTAGIQIPEIQPLQMVTPQCNCDCGCQNCTVIRSDSPHESYEIWLDPKDLLKTWQALIAAGATPVGSEALEIKRITAGVPLYGTDIHERDLPQETGQARALNFNKGCYVGQEIVERIRSRGNVHRQFAGFLVEGAATIAPGTKIVAGEKEVGEVTSATVLAFPVQTLLLGYVRREVGVPGRDMKGSELTIASYPAHIIQLPLDSVTLRNKDAALLHPA